jgi:hypothetical protein
MAQNLVDFEQLIAKCRVQIAKYKTIMRMSPFEFKILNFKRPKTPSVELYLCNLHFSLCIIDRKNCGFFS